MPTLPFTDVLVLAPCPQCRHPSNTRTWSTRLVGSACRLISASVAPTSRLTYETGKKVYRQFCNAQQWQLTPATEYGLTLFVGHLSQCRRSAQTAQVYLAGVRLLHLEHNASVEAFKGARLAAALQGLQCSGPPPRPARQPITLQQLRTLKERLFATRTLNLIDQEMIWAALTLAYFGLLRVSEYVSCNAHTFNADRTLTQRMVNIQPGLLHISLRASKNLGGVPSSPLVQMGPTFVLSRP